MRKCLVIPAVLLIAFLLALPASAVGVDDVYGAQAEALELDELEDAVPESAGAALDELSIRDGIDLDGLMTRLWEHISSSLRDAVSPSLKSAAAVALAALLCTAVSSVFPDAENYAVIACVLAVSAVTVADSASLARLGTETMDELNTFSKMLLPTLTAAAAAGGAVTSAAAKYAAAALFMDIFISAGKELVLPLIYAYIAASIASAAFGGDGLAGAASLIKWAASTVLTVIVLAFTAYLSITGVISGTADAVTVKAAKLTISTVLPVVGGMISDAADTLLAGASLLRGAVGVFGLIAVAAVITVPVLRIGANYLLYKAAGGLAGAASEPRLGKLITALSSAFGMLLGLVGAASLMLFISIISVVKAVS